MRARYAPDGTNCGLVRLLRRVFSANCAHTPGLRSLSGRPTPLAVAAARWCGQLGAWAGPGKSACDSVH
eukprot:scaffold2871_cov381-Prasinococcus_capsulatus_cf.AAC.4